MVEPSDRHQQRSRPTADDALSTTLAAALVRRRMSLVELRAALENRGHRVSLATLSYWRSGRRRPEAPASLDALAEIEVLLGLARGQLVDARGPARRAGPRRPTSSLPDLVPSGDPVTEALGSLDLEDWQERFCEDVGHTTIDVDQHGVFTRLHARLLLRAIGDHAQHFPVCLAAPQPVLEPFELLSLEGAEVTGHRADEAVGFALWRATLPRPLSVGETALVELEARFASIGSPDREYVNYVTQRMTQLTMWIRFDVRRLPRHCTLVVGDDGQDTRRTPVDVSATHSAHLDLRGFGPGLAGFELEW